MPRNFTLSIVVFAVFSITISVALADNPPYWNTLICNNDVNDSNKTNCSIMWYDDYSISYAYIVCESGSLECGGSPTHKTCIMSCAKVSGYSDWYSYAYDGYHVGVYRYWCTDTSSNVYYCPNSNCYCPSSYCGDMSCPSGEMCALDCPSETWCSDYVDNDEDGMTDSADSDCGGYCGDYICDYAEYCIVDCPNEYQCYDAIDNDGDSCIDSSDEYCGGKETSCTDGWDNDCDGYYDSADSDCFQETSGYCGDWYCSGNETVSNCPQDCCEWDCTSKKNNICYYECNGYNGCQTPSECSGVTSGVKICTSDSSYVDCCSDYAMYCGANKYCSGGSCVTCSSTCDGTCYSYNCLNDPDCNLVCGDGCCAQGENSATCPADCAAGQDCPVCNDYNPCTLDVCNATTGYLCDYWPTTPCCGNGVCESGEDSSNCPNDCAAEGELLLKIIYPRTNTSYFRGNRTQIRTQLSYGAERVYDGAVTCETPSKNTFNLEFDAELYYSGTYTIQRSDPSGTWNLICNASARRESQTKSDTDSVRLQIKDMLIINVSRIEGAYLQGQEVRIRVNAVYDNGTPASGVNINAITPEGNVTLEEVDSGVYELSYVMNTLGSFNISFTDLTGTTTFTGVSILSIKPFNPLDYVWLVPVVLVCGVVVFFGRKRMIKMKIKKGFEEELRSKETRMSEIKSEKKKLQDEFLQTRITEVDFKEKMKALDTEYQKIDMEIKDMKGNRIEKEKVNSP